MKTNEISVDRARLLAAAAVMRERGWAGNGLDEVQRVCLMQALAVVDTGAVGDWRRSVPAALLAIVCKLSPKYALEGYRPEECVACFNDTHCDSGETAIAILEQAAALS